MWRVTFHREHFTITGVTMLPRCSSRAFRSGAVAGDRQRAPFRRAVGWDGVMPAQSGYGLGQTMPSADLAAVVGYLREHREDGAAPLVVAVEGRTDGAAADGGRRHVVADRQAGLTWWVEALRW